MKLGLFKKTALIIMAVGTILFVATIISLIIIGSFNIINIPNVVSRMIIISFVSGSVFIVIGMILLIIATILKK